MPTLLCEEALALEVEAASSSWTCTLSYPPPLLAVVGMLQSIFSDHTPDFTSEQTSRPAMIKLWSNKQQQELYESKADLYAIIKATEKLERAYVRGEGSDPSLVSHSGMVQLQPPCTDAIPSAEYETLCEKLIQQFKVLSGSLKTAVGHMHAPTSVAGFAVIGSGLPFPFGFGQVPDVEKFMTEYNMQCPMAATRLLHSGLPATIEHKTMQR